MPIKPRRPVGPQHNLALRNPNQHGFPKGLALSKKNGWKVNHRPLPSEKKGKQ